MNDAESIFLHARERLVPEDRERYVAVQCANDVELRARVETLLRAAEAADEYFSEGSQSRAEQRCAPLLDEPGAVIGRYHLLECLGEGGMGIVYLAEQREPVIRRVALKIIKLGMDTRAVIARFEAERQVLALMDHPNIARVLDGGATPDGRPYFVMELVEGLSITRFCDEAQLPTRERLALFLEVCAAVQHAHQKGVIHRDLKPSNILVSVRSARPLPKVIDFGIAKATQGPLTDKTLLTQFQQLMGTPAYMSPEQASLTSLDVDTRSDIYSLGVLLYELLTRTTPFDGQALLRAGVDEMRRIICQEEPARPSARARANPGGERGTGAPGRGTAACPVDRDLDAIVMKCLEKDRSRRYATIGELAADLERHMADEPVLARAPSQWYRLQKGIRRRKTACIAGALVVLALAAGMTVSLMQLAAKKRALLASHQTRVRLNVANGTHRLSEGDAIESLAWFAQALELDAGGADKERVHRMRVASVLEACPRLVRAVVHDAEVNSACLSPDGRWLATASDDHTARLWDINGGGSEHARLPHRGPVEWIEFTSDGRRVATASDDGAARVWNVPDGVPVTSVLAHEGRVGIARFSPSGGLLLTASADGLARLWDSASGEELGRWPERGWVRYAEFDVTGGRFLTVSDDRHVRVRETATGKLIAAFPHPEGVHHAIFNKDGESVVSANGNREIVLWNIGSGREIRRRRAHVSHIRHLTFSADGTKLASSSTDGTARVWRYPSLDEVTLPLLHEGKIRKAAFSPDGRWIATASLDHSARVWDALTGRPVTPPLKHLGEVVWDVGFDRAGSMLVTACHDHTARLYDLTATTGPVLSFADGPPIKAARFSADGLNIVLARTNLLELYDSRNGSAAGHINSRAGPILCMDLSRDGRFAATAGPDGEVELWDLARREPATVPLSHPAPVKFCAFSPDSQRLLCISGDGSLYLWQATSGEALGVVQHDDGPILHATVDPIGRRMATAGAGGLVRLWDLNTLAPGAILTGHSKHVVHVAFSGDGQRLLTASEDRTIGLWDIPSGRRRLPPLLHSDKLVLAIFSPDGQRILSASVDRTAKLWDAATGNLLGQLRCKSRLSAAEFSADGARVLTGSTDCSARVWDVATGEPITPPFLQTGEILGAHFNPAGDQLIAFDDDGRAAVWRVATDDRPVDDLVRLARLFCGKSIDQQGTLVTLQASAFAELLKDLSARYPEHFTFPRQPLKSWHLNAARECTRAGNTAGALFHWDRLLALEPAHPVARRERAGISTGDR